MNFSSPTRAHGMFGALTLLAIFAFPALSTARTGLSDAYNISEEDLATLPPYCVAKISRKSDKALQAHWTHRFGATNWLHMHHYCFGLKAVQLAYQNFADSQQRDYQAGLAIDNFSYVLKHSSGDFFMRPEILVQRGRVLVIRREYDDAQRDYLQALKMNKKYIDAWAALSDLYSQTGKDDEAIKVLEQAIEETGEEHKKFTSRLNDLRKKPSR